MNRVYLLLTTVFVLFFFNGFSQPGLNCQTPYVIPSLPFTAQGLDTQDAQNHYDSPCTTDTCDMWGKDFVLTYFSPYDQYINISTGFTWQGFVGMWIFDNCPDLATGCIAHTTTGLGFTGPSLNNVFLNAGVTYYIVVSTDCAADVDYVTFSPNITESVRDCGVNLVSAPVSGCALSNNEAVTVRIHNNTTTAISNIPVKYQINNGTVVSETYTGSIPSNGNANFTFATHADLSSLGTYNISSFTQVLGDHNFTNDTSKIVVVNTFGVSSFPFQDSFDNGASHWTVGGTNPSWEIRHPAKQFINQPATDTACFVTNGTGSCNVGENSFIESPCFDMSFLTNPVLDMAIWFENAPGGTAFMSSIDNGATWQNVMANTNALNWYNVSGQWSGATHKWVIVKRSLSDFAGQSNVRFRFTLQSTNGGVDGFALDNFSIAECAPLPVAAFSYIVNGTTIAFQNTSINGLNFAWNYGDGSVSNLVSNSHTYATSGSYIVKLIVYNACGSDTITQTIDILTGINHNEISGFSIHPNPATDKVIIELGNIDNAVFELSDIRGSSIMRKNVLSVQKNITIENLAKGVYFVKINSEKNSIVRKLVIE